MKSLKRLTNAELWQRWKDTFDALGDPIEDTGALDHVEEEIIDRMQQAKKQAAQTHN